MPHKFQKAKNTLKPSLNIDYKSDLALIEAVILTGWASCERIVFPENHGFSLASGRSSASLYPSSYRWSGTTLILATAPVPVKIAAKAGSATTNKPSSTFAKLTIKKSPLRDFSLRS